MGLLVWTCKAVAIQSLAASYSPMASNTLPRLYLLIKSRDVTSYQLDSIMFLVFCFSVPCRNCHLHTYTQSCYDFTDFTKTYQEFSAVGSKRTASRNVFSANRWLPKWWNTIPCTKKIRQTRFNFKLEFLFFFSPFSFTPSFIFYLFISFFVF